MKKGSRYIRLDGNFFRLEDQFVLMDSYFLQGHWYGVRTRFTDLIFSFILLAVRPIALFQYVNGFYIPLAEPRQIGDFEPEHHAQSLIKALLCGGDIVYRQKTRDSDNFHCIFF